MAERAGYATEEFLAFRKVVLDMSHTQFELTGKLL